MTEAENFERFNLKTMSGVFAGSRTRSFQRLRLCSIDGEPPQRRWAQLLWYDEPAECVLTLLDATGNQPEGEHDVIWRDSAPEPESVIDTLQTVLKTSGWKLEACATCAHWQTSRQQTDDGFQVGRCCWTGPSVEPDNADSILLQQSSLALACIHWAEIGAIQPLQVKLEETVEPVAQLQEPAEQSGWRRWLAKFSTRQQGTEVETKQENTPIEERSGVGAGTDPCLVCQGRIANLSTLTLETPEGDKQTFSLWRCRICFTTYLNSWIDRWERLDTLETEEHIYRLSPAELIVAQGAIQRHDPRDEATRAQQRAWFETLTRSRIPLSHQIRQGR